MDEYRMFSGIEEVERSGSVIIRVGYNPKWEIKIYPGNVDLIDLSTNSVCCTKATNDPLENIRSELRKSFLDKDPGAVIWGYFGFKPLSSWYPPAPAP
jgi:hypothetical protein